MAQTLVKLISPDGKHPVETSEEGAQKYLALGWAIVGQEEAQETSLGSVPEVSEEAEIASGDLESDEDSVEFSERQLMINDAVAQILQENNPENFTGSGLPKVEVIARAAGLDHVSGAEREIALKVFMPED